MRVCEKSARRGFCGSCACDLILGWRIYLSAAYISTIFLYIYVNYCVHQVRKHEDAAAEALSPDEDCEYLIDLPHASDVERKVALQKALAASTAALESMQATAGFDMMVKRSNFRRDCESAGS